MAHTRSKRGLSNGLIDVNGGAKDADSEVSEVLCIVVELNPSDDAVVPQVLPNFRLANFQMLRQLGL